MTWLVGVLFLVLCYVAWRSCSNLLGRRRCPTAGSPTVERTLLNIAAVHEAGHAVVASLCTRVLDLHLVDADVKGQPMVEYTIIAGDGVSKNWCTAVIGLAGIAAEIDVFGRFSAVHASDDLHAVRRCAERCATVRRRSAARRRRPTPDFAKIFVDPPARDVIDVLEDAYREARSILSKRRVEHARLTGVLLHFGSLKRGEVDHYFGDRRFIRALAVFGLDFL